MQENITTGPQFEKNINALEKTVAAVSESSPESFDEKEIIRASLREAVSKNTAPPSQVKPSSDDSGVLPAYLAASSDEKTKEVVETLVKVALKEDLFKALSMARNSTPFIEDAFHDALVDKLLPELKRRGIIK